MTARTSTEPTQVEFTFGTNYDQISVMFHPARFYNATGRMEWKKLEREMSKHLRASMDSLYGEKMLLIDKLQKIINIKRQLITEAKRYYYKHECDPNALYSTGWVLNGFRKEVVQ
jgi:hypothetical protein